MFRLLAITSYGHTSDEWRKEADQINESIERRGRKNRGKHHVIKYTDPE